MDQSLIGHIGLNIALLTYVVVYLPQLHHNRDKHHLVEMSLWMHMMLLLAYVLDLGYGIASHLPWQYLTVSSAGLLSLSVQHTQIVRLLRAEAKFKLMWSLGCIWFVIIGMMGGCFISYQSRLDPHLITILGYAARILFSVYLIPQLYKNQRDNAHTALHFQFIRLNMMVNTLDLISAWCLNWDWPNKLGPLITMVILLILWPKRTTNDKHKLMPTHPRYQPKSLLE